MRDIAKKPLYPRIYMLLTCRCNLRCRMCSYMIAYINDPWHPSTEEIKKTLDRVFEIGDYKIFDFSGGEIFVRDDLAEILRYAYRYNEQVKEYWCIVTNCGFPLSTEMVNIIRTYGRKLKIKLDNYGVHSPYFASIKEELTEVGAWVEEHNYTGDKSEQYYGGWLMRDISYTPKRTLEEAEILHTQCQGAGTDNKMTIVDGRICYCSTVAIINYVYGLEFEECSFQLFDPNLSIEQIRMKCDDMWEGRIPHHVCRYHEKLNANVRDRISAAEQLTQTEIGIIINKNISHEMIYQIATMRRED